jgi:hypothetical protein
VSDVEQKPSLPSAIVRAGLSAIPVVGGALAELWGYAQALDRWRVSQMGATARDEFGDDEAFVDRLRSDERLLDMLVEAAEAAQRTSVEAKRIAMGRVLAQAMKDDARIDDSAAMLRALAEFEGPHFRILARLGTQPRVQIGAGNEEVPEPYLSQIMAQGVLRATEATIKPTANSFAGAAYVTPFGHELLRWIREGDRDTGRGPERPG